LVVLRISDPAGAAACPQLDSVVDPAGGAWVTSAAGDLGPYCVGCPQRVSVGIGYGLFILPSNDHAPGAPDALEIIAGARDCSTLLSAPTTAPTHLRIEGVFPTEVEPTRAGIISLGLAFLADSPLADQTARAAVLPETLRQVNAMLAPGGLQVTVARSRSVGQREGVLELVRGDDGPLDALYGEVLEDEACPPAAAQDGPGWVPVVFAGCIRVVDPLLQTTSEPDGMTPGIPDGFPPLGRAHGIYLKGQSCRPGMAPINWTPSLLAKLLAHELGHYLGLYHSVEADGTVDQLADTDENNIMYNAPLTVSAPTFSPSQFRVMRRHPVISFGPSD
jgi:hypothetical protein